MALSERTACQTSITKDMKPGTDSRVEWLSKNILWGDC
jgi:hypothetical protein